MSWYKDRDFPELKREIDNGIDPNEFLAIINDPKQIEAVIRAHDEEMNQVLKLAEDWKKGYSDLQNKHKIKITEMQQIIYELEDEIKELKKTT